MVKKEIWVLQRKNEKNSKNILSPSPDWPAAAAFCFEILYPNLSFSSGAIFKSTAS